MHTRSAKLLPLALAILTTLLLAGSLSGLELRGGTLALPQISEAQMGEPGGFSAAWLGELLLRCLMGFLLLGLIGFPFYILFSLRSKRGRQRLLADLLAIGVFLIIMSILYRSLPQTEEELVAEETPIPLVQDGEPILGGDGAGGPLAEEPPPLPAWAGWAAAAALAGLSTLAAAWWLNRRRPPLEPMALERLAGEAQQALDSLRGGADVEEVIIRCYLAMSRVLEEERRIQRQDSMTPREFERLLLAKGLPANPVRRLTRLFEDVRYGARPPAAREEDLAVLSLTEIVQHVRGGAG
jgi:hypothetical protein